VAVELAARLSGLLGGTNGARRSKQWGGIAPNRACSGRGYAPRRPARQNSEKSSPSMVVDSAAPPLTPSLGDKYTQDEG